MKKIKILHIIKSLGRGGAEMLLPETLKLHSDNFEFHYIYFLSWKTEMVEAIQDAGGKVKCLPVNNNIELLLKYKEVLDYAMDNEIQLVHCHLPWAGFLGRIIYTRSNIPVVYTEHNLQDRYHFVTKILNKYSYNKQTLAFGVSQDVTQSINNSISPKIPVETLLNGVNTQSFNPEISKDQSVRNELNIPEDAIVIGNVTVFRFQKRLVEWLQVFSEIQKKHENVYGIIVGFGPLEDEVKTELQRLNLENKVFLPGLKREVKPYYNAMDIFMMSSSFEGLPIALLEAMSMKCAIVSTDAGGIKEVLRKGEDGLICNVEDWKDLAGLSSKLIADPVLLERFKNNSRKRVEESFSLKAMVEKLEQEYSSLIMKSEL